MTSLYRLLCIVGVMVSLRGISTQAQVSPPPPNDPSPATRHAQVIAHGVMTMPGDDIGWRVTVPRAVMPHRAVAKERPAGFVLADKGAIALVDPKRNVLARMAPGEAVWIAAGTSVAVVSLEVKAVDFVDVALRPAANLNDGGLNGNDSVPFAAPTGDVFDVDLIRDVLERGEESPIRAGLTPSVVVVTRGEVWLTPVVGETVPVTAGESVQFEGDVVITGASRQPAAFVVARVGPETPTGAALETGAATSAHSPGATPTAPPVLTVFDDPTLAGRDTDADGLLDGDETDFYGTDPRDPDTDGDALDDGAELLTHGTNPFLTDTDGDAAPDSEEIAAGTIPIDVASVPQALAPTPEATPAPGESEPPFPGTVVGLEPSASPVVGADPEADGDPDGDGLTTLDEVSVYGTDPIDADSDGDGFSDGGETASGMDPLDPSSFP